MKQLIILIVVLVLFSSCKKDPSGYQVRILIRNETDSLLKVKLYPKYEYMRFDKYSYSDRHAKFKDTVFVPESRYGTELYITDDLTIEPQLLTSRIFDSINIFYKSGKKLRFSSMGSANYPLNLFTDRSAWIYERNRFEHVMMWRDSYIQSDDYFFVLTNN